MIFPSQNPELNYIYTGLFAMVRDHIHRSYGLEQGHLWEPLCLPHSSMNSFPACSRPWFSIACRVKSHSSTWHFQVLHDGTLSCFSRFLSHDSPTLHHSSHRPTESWLSSHTFWTALSLCFTWFPLPGILSSFFIIIAQDIIHILPLPKYAFLSPYPK